MIGIFDSGYGGLSIFREIIHALPTYDFLYFGDNARAPYGNHSRDVIYEHTREACEWLFRQGCELIVLACNTASAQALRRLQQEYLPHAYPERRILGVLVPIAEAVSRQVQTGDTIGVIATRATVESEAYVRELEKYIPKGVRVIQRSCPLLVPLVEEGWLDHTITREVLRGYLEPLRRERLKTLILGCTHYSFLRDSIRKEMAADCFIPDPSEVVAHALYEYLSRHPERDAKLSKNGLRRFVTTDSPERFAEFAVTVGIPLHAKPEQVRI